MVAAGRKQSRRHAHARYRNRRIAILGSAPRFTALRRKAVALSAPRSLPLPRESSSAIADSVGYRSRRQGEAARWLLLRAGSSHAGEALCALLLQARAGAREERQHPVLGSRRSGSGSYAGEIDLGDERERGLRRGFASATGRVGQDARRAWSRRCQGGRPGRARPAGYSLPHASTEPSRLSTSPTLRVS